MTTSQTKPAGRFSSAPAKRTPRAARRTLTAVEGLVFLAITLVAVALGTGLYLQFGMQFWIATVCALSVYVGLLSMHSLIRRRDTVDELRGEIARLQGELHRTHGGGRPQQAAPAGGNQPATTRKPELFGEASVSAANGGTEAVARASSAQRVAHGRPTEASREKTSTSLDKAPQQTFNPAPSPAGDGLADLPPPAQVSQTVPTAHAEPKLTAAPDRSDNLDEFWVGLDLDEQNSPVQAQPAETPRPTAEAAKTTPAVVQVDNAHADQPADPTSNYEVIAAPPDNKRQSTAAASVPPANKPEGFGQEKPSANNQSDSPAATAAPINSPTITTGPLTDASGDDDGPPTLIGATQSRSDANTDTPSSADAERELADDAPVMPPREKDVELIQGLIKKLADEVNAMESQQAEATPSAPDTPQQSAADPEAAIESSVGALRTAVGSMRVYDEVPTSDTAPTQPLHSPADLEGFEQIDNQAAPAHTPTAQAAPPPVGPSHTRLAAVADAITSGRIDVMLEPILGLKDKRTRHFEVSVRLRGSDGAVLDAPQDVPEIAGTGLLPLLDSGHIGRTAQLTNHLRARGKSGAVFTSVAPESLTADRFLNAFDATHQASGELSRQLVMTFSQFDIRRFGANEWQTVHHMKTLGFRFAISAVTDMDMDFEDLKSKGFDFVKLDAEVFLEGLPTGEGRIPSADVCGFLSQLGMTLIVGHIDDDSVLARIHALGVLYGQGQLFGGARPVKQEALGLPASHAAA